MPSRKKESVKSVPKHVLVAKVKQQDLLIERLKTEVKGLEASHQNLRMLYEVSEKHANRMVEEKVNALVSLREAERLADRASNSAEIFLSDLCKYEGEGAVAMWFRSMRTALAPVTQSIADLFEWIVSKVRR